MSEAMNIREPMKTPLGGRHRTCSEAEKILMQYKFAEYCIAKRIRSISLPSFSR